MKTGFAGVLENFLAFHVVDEEGSYEVHEEVRHDPGPMSGYLSFSIRISYTFKGYLFIY